MTTYTLDTNTLFYLIKNKPPSVAERINARGDDAVPCMSFFTFAELLKGAERSVRGAQVLRQLDRLSREIPVLYDTRRALCEHYAVQFVRLKKAGTLIGANDLWIACHALSANATLVTHNLRKFQRIQGLRVEDWVD